MKKFATLIYLSICLSSCAPLFLFCDPNPATPIPLSQDVQNIRNQAVTSFSANNESYSLEPNIWRDLAPLVGCNSDDLQIIVGLQNTKNQVYSKDFELKRAWVIYDNEMWIPAISKDSKRVDGGPRWPVHQFKAAIVVEIIDSEGKTILLKKENLEINGPA